jgi:DNA polymerase-3 subunit epsilon
VVEIGIVFLSRNLDIIGEFETLVYPGREVSATSVHGISADMVQLAPTFEEIGPHVAALLNNHILVAHNLQFDTRFLSTEMERVQITFDAGSGIDTLALSGKNLVGACQERKISYPNHHRALFDARATAALLRHFGLDPAASPAIADEVRVSTVRTHRRPEAYVAPDSPVVPVRIPGAISSEVAYMATLDCFLSDLVLSSDEQKQLHALAQDVGLTKSRVQALHDEYFDGYVEGAMRDGIISLPEHNHLKSLACALGISVSKVPFPSQRVEVALTPGLRVCFTGSDLNKEALGDAARTRGLQPVPNVTKKGCDLVVASSAASSTGKAATARKYGIPVVSAQEFESLLRDTK